jgi:hypothetical protein
LKHETCPYPQLEEIWNDIVPLSFKEIAKFENLEQRRIGIVCLGLDRLVNDHGISQPGVSFPIIISLDL